MAVFYLKRFIDCKLNNVYTHNMSKNYVKLHKRNTLKIFKAYLNLFFIYQENLSNQYQEYVTFLLRYPEKQKLPTNASKHTTEF